jgi:hypothetical protein
MSRLAMAWDGQWFLKVYEEFDWETAARLNIRVRHAFARIEMLLTLRALDKTRATDLKDATRILQTYYDQLLSSGFQGEFRLEGDAAHITVSECAALTGSRRAQLERQDQACLTCTELFRVYYETLLRGYSAQVTTLAQMGDGAEQCLFQVRVQEP